MEGLVFGFWGILVKVGWGIGKQGLAGTVWLGLFVWECLFGFVCLKTALGTRLNCRRAGAGDIIGRFRLY